MQMRQRPDHKTEFQLADSPTHPDPREMTDDELRRAWNDVRDHDDLSPFDQQLIDEMAKRDLDF